MKKKTALIIGAARSGRACARFFVDRGYSVVVVDHSSTERTQIGAAQLPPGVDVHLGSDGMEFLGGVDVVSPSPGVPWEAPLLEAARGRGIAIESEMELVFRHCPGVMVGITGTNGKTTTTTLVGAILRRGNRPVHVGGNIGATLIDRIDEIHEGDFVVVELSSVQLESMSHPRCHVGIVLNITPDHLDRHHSMERYVASKQKLVTAAGNDDTVILNADDTYVAPMASITAAHVRTFGLTSTIIDGAAVDGDSVVVRDTAGTHAVLAVADISLFGAHNVANVLAAVAVSDTLGISHTEIANAVANFTPVTHRLETVAHHGGVLWVNDSKATNVDAAITALRAFANRPVVWIGGGGSKGVAPDPLLDEVVRRVRFAIVNGESAAELNDGLQRRGFVNLRQVQTLHDAIVTAAEVAQPGDVVVLAPGYTSYDQFTDYEARGDYFRDAVRKVIGC